jgi:hypothetical protein
MEKIMSDQSNPNQEENVNKQGWIWLAPQYFDQWRVFPRLFIVFYLWLCMETAIWFMGLIDPTTAQAGFAGAIVSAGAAWFGLYVNSGPRPVSMPEMYNPPPSNNHQPANNNPIPDSNTTRTNTRTRRNNQTDESDGEMDSIGMDDHAPRG